MTQFVDMTTPVEAMDDATLTMAWYRVDQELAAIKTRELELRKALFARSFPTPTEGSANNKLPLAEGWILQGDYKINRSVDEAVVSALYKGDNTRALAERVFRWKPELNLKEYNALSPEDKLLVADAVTEKPGTPALEIKLPKR